MLNKLTEWRNVRLTPTEQLVKDFYEKDGWAVEVAPVIVQRMCCFDFYLVKGSKEKLVELKADARAASTGNFFVETLIIRDEGINSPGWYAKLPAHLFPNFKTCPHLISWLMNDTLLEVHTEELIDLVDSSTEWKERETKGAYRARGYLIPVDDVASLLSTKIYKLT